MSIKVDITGQDEDLLAGRASITQTFYTAMDALEICAEDGKDDAEQFSHCLEEMGQLTPALDRLHRSVRAELLKLVNDGLRKPFK